VETHRWGEERLFSHSFEQKTKEKTGKSGSIVEREGRPLASSKRRAKRAGFPRGSISAFGLQPVEKEDRTEFKEEVKKESNPVKRRGSRLQLENV